MARTQRASMRLAALSCVAAVAMAAEIKAGPVPQRQHSALVQYASSEYDSEIRWLSVALLRSPAHPRWSELAQAQDGIVRRLTAALSHPSSIPRQP